MAHFGLEVADILRDHGPAWRAANRGHVSLEQMKVMSAIERCRTAALGGHVARCEKEGCGYPIIAFTSCRDRHCPKCQAAASRDWLAEREAELLPVRAPANSCAFGRGLTRPTRKKSPPPISRASCRVHARAAAAA